MNNIIKLLSTLIITGGFVCALWLLGTGCWPCCSFLAWCFVMACIWNPGMKIKMKGTEQGEDIIRG